MIYRRQRRQYIFAGVLAVIAIVNVLFFFILNRPVRAEYGILQDSIGQLEGQTRTSRQYFGSLEKTSTQLDRFDQDKRALLMMHLVQRNMGYSQIVTQLNSIVQRAGVKKTRVVYNFDSTPQAGLNAVSIVLPVEGSYPNIVNFIREIENSDTFFLITAINVESASQSNQPGVAGGAGGSVALSLSLETYFYQ